MTEDTITTRRLEAVVIAMLAFPLLNGIILPFLIYRPALFWIVDAFQWVVITGVCWLFLFAKWKFPFALFGLVWPVSVREKIALLVHTAVWAILFIWIYATLQTLALMLYPWETYPAAFTFHMVIPET